MAQLEGSDRSVFEFFSCLGVAKPFPISPWGGSLFPMKYGN